MAVCSKMMSRTVPKLNSRCVWLLFCILGGLNLSSQCGWSALWQHRSGSTRQGLHHFSARLRCDSPVAVSAFPDFAGVLPNVGDLFSGPTHDGFDSFLCKSTLDADTLACLEDRRTRKILRGLSVIRDKEPEIRKAFQIVYDDIMPVRVASDMIFPRMATTARTAADATLTRLSSAGSTWRRGELAAIRRGFDAADRSGSGVLRRDDMFAPGLLRDLGFGSGTDDEIEVVQGFVRAYDRGGDHALSFADFVSAVAAVPQMLHRIANQKSDFDKGQSGAVDEAGNPISGPGKRFSDMIDVIRTWEHIPFISAATEGERLALVIRGTIAGTKCPEVLQALRMMYEDYGPIRLAGDLIFKVMNAWLERKRVDSIGRAHEQPGGGSNSWDWSR